MTPEDFEVYGTRHDPRIALSMSLALSNQRMEGTGPYTPSAILPSEEAQAREILDTLKSGGWHLVHADDLPAGYMPGDKVFAAWELNENA